MVDVTHLLKGYRDDEIIAAIYFAVRHIKQARTLTALSKDMFQDGPHSRPTARVKKLATDIVADIETRLGKSSTDFDDKVLWRVARELSEIALSYRSKSVAASDVSEAKSFIERLLAS